jgi:non-ribosomal peptide synthetase component F
VEGYLLITRALILAQEGSATTAGQLHLATRWRSLLSTAGVLPASVVKLPLMPELQHEAASEFVFRVCARRCDRGSIRPLTLHRSKMKQDHLVLVRGIDTRKRSRRQQLQRRPRRLPQRLYRLAWRLVEIGVGPETYVGLCMGKSKFGVIATVAILRAGGAVVPLGVQHPVARIESIAQETHAAVVLVDQTHYVRLATLESVLYHGH